LPKADLGELREITIRLTDLPSQKQKLESIKKTNTTKKSIGSTAPVDVEKSKSRSDLKV
jgi:hypothetical protein